MTSRRSRSATPRRPAPGAAAGGSEARRESGDQTGARSEARPAARRRNDMRARVVTGVVLGVLAIAAFVSSGRDRRSHVRRARPVGHRDVQRAAPGGLPARDLVGNRGGGRCTSRRLPARRRRSVGDRGRQYRVLNAVVLGEGRRRITSAQRGRHHVQHRLHRGARFVRRTHAARLRQVRHRHDLRGGARDRWP